MILVTGGTGLLGSHLVPELLLAGERVRVLIREGSNNRKVLKVWNHFYPGAEKMFDEVEWFRGDITNRASVIEAFGSVNKVFHCAAYISFEKMKQGEMFQVNVIGTRNIVDACLQFTGIKLLHVSSIAAIGPGEEGEILTEENRWLVNPQGSYSLTKTLAEQEVWRGICEGLNAVIINPSIILGAGITDQGSAKIFKTIKKGLKFYTNGMNGFVDVRDVVGALILLMNSEISGERFIINNVNLSFRELFTKIADELNTKSPSLYASPFLTSLAWKAGFLFSKLTGKRPIITKESARSSHKIQQYSSEKLLKMTGFTFTDFDFSIREIARYYN